MMLGKREELDNNVKYDVLSNLLQTVRKIEKEKLDKNVIIYPDDMFRKLNWKDNAISRVVARYQDIMLVVEIFEKFDSTKMHDDITNLKKMIFRVHDYGDLDRTVYVRVFQHGYDGINSAVILQRGYVDGSYEFNEDILDVLNVALNEIEEKLENNQELNELEAMFTCLLD